MLLQRLKDYADAGRVENMAPVGYKETQIRYIVELDASGGCLGVVDQAQGGSAREKRGKAMLAPHAMRAYAIRPKLLADNAEYALGIARDAAKQGRVDESHQAFVALVRACAEETGEVAVQTVLAFLESGADVRPHFPSDFEPGMVVTFRVGDTVPIDLASVRAFWARRSGGSDAEYPDGDGIGDQGDRMECLVCGQVRPAMRRLSYKWQGVPNGQTSGLAVISANANAFESYGLEESLIAPTCAECGERFSKAANALLSSRSTCLRVGPLAYIFWTRDPVEGFSWGGFIEDPKSEDVRELLRAPQLGRVGAIELDSTPFYVAALSASGARVVVRDWLDTTVGQAKANLRRYFALQRIVDWDGGDAPLKLVALAGATVRELKDMAPGTPRAILRLALEGGVLPYRLLFEAVRRCRAEGKVTRPRAALIKMVLLTNQSTNGREGMNVVRDNLVELDLKNRDPAYLCGRLLAVLEAIQRAALGDINATIVDRYYGTASSAPASVFARLLRGAQPHLGKLRRDPRKQRAYLALQNRLMDIMNENGGLATFPTVLNLPDQGLFALGYYHQRASDRAAARQHRELAALVSNPDGDATSSEMGTPSPN